MSMPMATCVRRPDQSFEPHEEHTTTRSSWVPWPTDGWVASREQETQFIHELRLRGAKRVAAPTRADATVLVNALRCGIDAHELLERMPGVCPENLGAAHEDLDARRARAALAWLSIVRRESIAALVEHGAVAAQLLPGPIGRLSESARDGMVSFAGSVRVLAEEVSAARHHALRLEHALAEVVPGSAQGRRIAELLYHPFSDAVAVGDFFLADRVAMLSPQRVAALLGETDCPVSASLHQLSP